jgi:putative membrane protein
VFTALALSAVAFHPWHGGFLFFLIPLFWILLIVGLFALFGRRRWRNGGFGPHAHYGWQGWQHAQSAAGAESVLAQRYANGDIDEKEYRARLEVLRSSGPVPPVR